MPGIRIIGIDPGLSRVGWAIVDELECDELLLVSAGFIETKPSSNLSDRLLQIHNSLSGILRQFHPSQGAIEKIFVNLNAKSSLKLAYARGSIMLSVALNNIPITEYAPNLIKSIIAGNGFASKAQLKIMLEKQIKQEITVNEHNAIDAIAIAMCHSLKNKNRAIMTID